EDRDQREFREGGQVAVAGPLEDQIAVIGVRDGDEVGERVTDQQPADREREQRHPGRSSCALRFAHVVLTPARHAPRPSSSDRGADPQGVPEQYAERTTSVRKDGGMRGEDVRTVGVVGCGLMGSGIVEVAARAGQRVTYLESSDELVEAGRARIERSMLRAVERGRLEASVRDAAL